MQGPEGAQGTSGALAIYGDGSAGDFTHPSYGNPKYLNLGYGTLPAGNNLMFEDLVIEGPVFVSSGTTLRATGNITIASTGLLVVQPEQQIQTINPSQKGLALSASQGFQAGRGLELGRAAQLTRFDLLGGGSGYRSTTNPNVVGGEGGGRVILAAKGNVIIRGLIDADGRNSSNIAYTGGPMAVGGGGGGGGGGAVTILSRGTISVEGNGSIRARGGNGAAGYGGTNPTPGALYGGGGGGGGGIVQFLSANQPQVANAANIQVNGGAAGTAAVSGPATTLAAAGGGGGACGGSGGDGTSSTVAAGASQPGTTGDFVVTVAAQPELLFY